MSEAAPVIDKSSWPRGPWHSEPDKLQWVDPETGLDCLIVRNSMGALCGYVGVAEGHPLFGVEYSDPSPALAGALAKRMGEPMPETPGIGLMVSAMSGNMKPTAETALDVHGGITYSEFCRGSICHVAEPGRPDRVWWLGFDCAHAGDHIPSWSRPSGDTYRDVAFVKSECAALAKQLKEVVPVEQPAET